MEVVVPKLIFCTFSAFSHFDLSTAVALAPEVSNCTIEDNEFDAFIAGFDTADFVTELLDNVETTVVKCEDETADWSPSILFFLLSSQRGRKFLAIDGGVGVFLASGLSSSLSIDEIVKYDLIGLTEVLSAIIGAADIEVLTASFDFDFFKSPCKDFNFVVTLGVICTATGVVIEQSFDFGVTVLITFASLTSTSYEGALLNNKSLIGLMSARDAPASDDNGDAEETFAIVEDLASLSDAFGDSVTFLAVATEGISLLSDVMVTSEHD